MRNSEKGLLQYKLFLTYQMTSYLDNDEYERWIYNSRRTLESAINDKNSKFYNWSCFKAQQSAEYAAKAYMRGIGKDSFGHSVSGLLKKADFIEDIINKSKTLDKYYIPTRYTDAWSEGTPDDYYTEIDCDIAIECCKSIIQEVEDKWKSLSKES
ncbi:MAG: HEPN domain-containing protein [Thermoplasmataceae archaeon]